MVSIDAPKVISHLLAIEDHVDDFLWVPFKDGIDIFRIYNDDESGPSAALLRYAAGAEVPMHLHTGYEHILILSGSQSDGLKLYEKGMLMISSPGSQHLVTSEAGCIVLAIWQTPVQFINTMS